MLAYLRRRRSQLNDWLTRRGLAHTFSLPTYQLYRHTLPLVEAHARGPCLDAGSGRSPWKPTLVARGIEVLSLDVEDRAGEVDVIADVQAMPVIGDGTIGSVLCTQVLEHLPRPWEAVAEMARVLAAGGYLILSVPHLSVIHEAPHDYYRFTRWGLGSLLKTHGFEVVRIVESGGLLSFLAHGLSMVFFGILGSLPGLRRLVWSINALVLIHLLGLVDRLFGASAIYPCNYVVLARKSEAAPAAPGGSA
ncbi:MAG: class I SAM-dependent methyltransferase [bacterium]|nr:class I SAM-dependent methyltransferase [bacterium]